MVAAVCITQWFIRQVRMGDPDFERRCTLKRGAYIRTNQYISSLQDFLWQRIQSYHYWVNMCRKQQTEDMKQAWVHCFIRESRMIQLYRLFIKLEGLGWAEEISKLDVYSRDSLEHTFFDKAPKSFPQGQIRVFRSAYIPNFY